jgi:Tol biopolymer transport system component
MRPAFSRIQILILGLLVAGAFACGDDDGDDDDGGGGQLDAGPEPDAGDDGDAGDGDAGEGDAGTEPDAGPTGPAQVWFHGDFATNGRVQLGGYSVGGELPATAAPILPGGDTGQLATFQSVNSGAYDISRNGDVIAIPTDLEVAGRFDLYVGPADGSSLNQAVVMTETADVAKARLSPNGALIAFTADLEVDGRFDAYVVPADAVGATPTRVSPADAFDDVDDVVWSRDSSSFLITGEFTEAGFFELAVVDVTGAKPALTTLVARGDIAATAGASGAIQPLARRGNVVVFKGRMDDDNRIKLYTVDATGGGVDVLPGSEIVREDDTFASIGRTDASPNGESIAFAADTTEGIFDVYVIPSEGGTAQPLTSGLTRGGPETGQPIKWRRDGQSVAFVADYTVAGKGEPWIAPVDGSGHRRLINMAPDSPGIGCESVDWSPDGSQVFVVANYVLASEDELFVLDAAATDQETATLVLDTVEGGDLRFDLTVTN